jgi:DNA-binding beta-propeller fold protein YncE
MGKCTCHDKKTHELCVACTIDQMARNHYFPGKWLDTRTFEVEQAYGMGKDRRHNRYLHGTGVTCGLKVKQHPNPACRNRFVLVEPGIAIDCCGREIFIKEEETVDFRELFIAAWQEAHGDESPPDDATHTFQLCIHYAECPTEEVAVLFNDCNCDDTALQPNQVLETYSFSLKLDPATKVTEPQGVELEWVNTLNVARTGFVAHDADAALLYVLAQHTIYVYQTDNYALFGGSHTLPTDATALALSGDGTRLYVALDDNSVQVLDSANLGNASALVNTLTHSALVTRLVVSPADGNLYALSPSNSTVTAWDDTINTAGADLTAANLGTVTVGGGAADMVITPDGTRVIVANSADSSLSVFDPTDLASGATTQTLNLAPSALAIAATTSDTRLYVADSITPSVQILDAASFAAISAVETLSDAPLALAVSPGGRWLYATVSVAGEGQLWVIDTHALEAGDVVIGGNVAIGDNPQQPVLALGDGLVYVPFTGDPAVDTSGGVAVVTVTESACDALFEATLDGCPACECEDDSGLVLATVTEYIFDGDVTDEGIDNLRDRTLLPSTQVLYEVLLCLLNREVPTGGAGEQGPPGQPGQGITAVNVTFVDCTDPGSFTFDPATGALALEIPRGCDGADGADGINGAPGLPGQGVDQVVVNFIPCDQPGSSSFADGILTINLPSGCGDNDVKYGHICAINWNHNKETSHFQLGRGLIVAFDVPVRNGDLHQHTFRVEVGLPQDNQFGAICWCEIRPQLLTGVRLPENCVISDNIEFIQGDDEAKVNGAIFVPANIQPGFTYRVYVEGDHIRTLDPETGEWGTALDANFLRSELPTGDDVEGGQFYSWFDLSLGN